MLRNVSLSVSVLPFAFAKIVKLFIMFVSHIGVPRACKL